MAKKNKKEREAEVKSIAEDKFDMLMLELVQALPWDRIILSGIFTYGWYKAYGSSSLKPGDIALGFLYGFTIPDALRGGIVANSYAVSALAALGVGLLPDDVKQSALDQTVDSFTADVGGYPIPSIPGIGFPPWLIELLQEQFIPDPPEDPQGPTS